MRFMTPEGARGLAITYLVLDEAAFIPGMEDYWKSMYPVVSAGGNVIVISTVNGLGNWYEQMYTQAKNKKNEVTGVEIMADPFTVSDAPVGLDETLPVRFALLPAAPNPFTALGTKVRFDLPEPANVTLRIYGVDGGIVRTLANDAAYPAGRHALTWDGRNDQGLAIHGGVYFIKIEAGPKRAVQKVVRVTR